jgi:hypothetical protein
VVKLRLKKASLLDMGELDGGHCDIPLSLEENERSVCLRVSSYKQSLLKMFHKLRSLSKILLGPGIFDVVFS